MFFLLCAVSIRAADYGNVCNPGPHGKIDYEYTDLAKLQADAEAGTREAQLLLARAHYLQIPGISQDKKKAVEILRKSADQGCLAAQHNLATYYLKGDGVEKDSAQAEKWYRKAADLGFAMSQAGLGRMYFSGLGVEKDEALGVKWFRQAAEQGEVFGQYHLGRSYFLGRGVEKDASQACAWFEKAAAQGFKGATEVLEKHCADNGPSADEDENDPQDKNDPQDEDNPQDDPLTPPAQTHGLFGHQQASHA